MPATVIILRQYLHYSSHWRSSVTSFELHPRFHVLDGRLTAIRVTFFRDERITPPPPSPPTPQAATLICNLHRDYALAPLSPSNLAVPLPTFPYPGIPTASARASLRHGCIFTFLRHGCILTFAFAVFWLIRPATFWYGIGAVLRSRRSTREPTARVSRSSRAPQV